MITEPKPSLLEVLHAKSFPALCPFDHKPIAKKSTAVLHTYILSLVLIRNCALLIKRPVLRNP